MYIYTSHLHDQAVPHGQTFLFWPFYPRSDAKNTFCCCKCNTEIAKKERKRVRERQKQLSGEMRKIHSEPKDPEKFQRKSSPLVKY